MTSRLAYLPAIALAASSLVALAACSSYSSGGIVPPASAPSLQYISFGKSNAQSLYVSDSGTNEVETFAWPKPQSPTGTLNDFSEPQEECADQSGDVFVTNAGGSNIFEYKELKQFATLTDPNEYPVDCSFDTRNGDLAVADIVGTNDGPGGVGIYKHARGTPKMVPGGLARRVFSVQYDGSGNLFALDDVSASGSVLIELAAGSKKFNVICPNGFKGAGKTVYPGSLGWDGTYLVIGNQADGGVSRVEVRGCKAVGTTMLVGSSDIVQFAIANGRLVGADAGNANVEIYDYPKGGRAVQILTGEFSQPIGVAISQYGNGD